MNPCPKCGRYMTFEFNYFCGVPRAKYVCKYCNYDTTKDNTVVATGTAQPVETMYLHREIPYGG